MNNTRILILTTLLILVSTGIIVFAQGQKGADDWFVSFIVDAKKQDLKLYWKNEKGENFKSIQNLRNWLEIGHKQLLFAMNVIRLKDFLLKIITKELPWTQQVETETFI